MAPVEAALRADGGTTGTVANTGLGAYWANVAFVCCCKLSMALLEEAEGLERCRDAKEEILNLEREPERSRFAAGGGGYDEGED